MDRVQGKGKGLFGVVVGLWLDKGAGGAEFLSSYT